MTENISSLRALAVAFKALRHYQSVSKTMDNVDSAKVVNDAMELESQLLDVNTDWEALVIAIADLGLDPEIVDHVMPLVGVLSHPKTPKSRIDINKSIHVEYTTISGRLVAMELRQVESAEEVAEIAEIAREMTSP